MTFSSLFDRFSRPGAFRLFLAWVVVLHHFQYLALGTWSVYVFFILSGYWISRMWDRKYRSGRQPYLTFIASRYWRLWPLYVLCLTLCVSLVLCVSTHKREILAVVSSPFWIARSAVILSSASQPLFLVPSWTLDIEMQFYLLAPLLCFFFVKRGGKLSSAVIVSYAFISLAGIAAFWFLQGAIIYRYLTFFLAGMMIYQTDWRPSRLSAIGALALMVVCVSVVFWVPAWRPIMGVDVMTYHDKGLHLSNARLSGALALMILPWIAYSVSRPDNRMDRHLGNLAYSVYLFHYIVFLAIDQIHHLKVMPHSVVYIGGLVAVALGSTGLYLGFEAPIERIRRAAINKAVLPEPER
jgi:peptidoglycan/LPS O-acetylase OafA/YrhL